MPGNKYNSNNHIPDRIERLLRDRELRKNTRAILNESSDNSISNNSISCLLVSIDELHLDLEASSKERLDLANFVRNEPLLYFFSDIVFMVGGRRE
ncbi:TPS1.1a [Sesbania bispinosa]|nr:TPS1.1a [Sesbania bispinosa]